MLRCVEEEDKANAGKSNVMVLNGEEGLKVASGRRVADAIRSVVNARGLLLECARVLHEALLVPVLIYGSVTMLCKKERYRIISVQMDSLTELLGIRRMDRVLNTQIGEFQEKMIMAGE